MFFKSKQNKFSEELSQWLAHPNEFGTTPKKVEHVESKKLNYMLCDGKHETYLFNYEMPDGTKGRGFVNPITWTFMGDVENVSNADLLLAYCGWTFFFVGTQKGIIKTDIDEAPLDFIIRKIKNDLSEEMELKSKFDVQGITYLEFEGTVNGLKARQAIGNDGSSLYIKESDARFGLPALYYMLGHIQQN